MNVPVSKKKKIIKIMLSRQPNSWHMYFCENLDFFNVPRDSGHDVFNNFDILCCDGALAKQAWTHVYLSTLTNFQSHKCSNRLV